MRCIQDGALDSTSQRQKCRPEEEAKHTPVSTRGKKYRASESVITSITSITSTTSIHGVVAIPRRLPHPSLIHVLAHIILWVEHVTDHPHERHQGIARNRIDGLSRHHRYLMMVKAACEAYIRGKDDKDTRSTPGTIQTTTFEQRTHLRPSRNIVKPKMARNMPMTCRPGSTIVCW